MKVDITEMIFSALKEFGIDCDRNKEAVQNLLLHFKFVDFSGFLGCTADNRLLAAINNAVRAEVRHSIELGNFI